MPDECNCCKHYSKQKISRDPPELHEFVENRHILCNVFGHCWKVEENRWRVDADQETESLEEFRLIGIICTCKKCGKGYWEYFPHDRFKKDFLDFEEIE